MLYIEDPYTSYCLDEAVAFIILKMQDGENPTFMVKKKSFTDIYKDYLRIVVVGYDEEIEFYEKCGFRPDGNEMYNDNVKASEIRMTLVQS